MARGGPRPCQVNSGRRSNARDGVRAAVYCILYGLHKDKPLGFPRRCRQKTPQMLVRRFAIPLMLLVAVVGIAGALYAQLETGDRGIPPLDSSNTLEIGGIHVDVGGTDAQSARYAGWRIAQRQGFKMLWAKMHNASVNDAPALPD